MRIRLLEANFSDRLNEWTTSHGRLATAQVRDTRPAGGHAKGQVAAGYYTVYLYRCDLKVAIATVLPIAIGQDLLLCQQ